MEGPCEYSTLEDLRSHGVPHLPRTFYGGNVPDVAGGVQRTIARSLFSGNPGEDAWYKGDPDPVMENLLHARLVLEILYPLTEVRNEEEYVGAMRDVLQSKCHFLLHIQ